jgi:exopolysaccharide biosynthesis polyprenyl glycosylphosphotransferase
MMTSAGDGRPNDTRLRRRPWQGKAVRRLWRSDRGATEVVDDGGSEDGEGAVVKSDAYMGYQRPQAGSDALVLEEVVESSMRGAGASRTLVIFVADILALLVAVLGAALLVAPIAHLPVLGRPFAEFAEVRPPLLAEFLIIPWTIVVLYGYGMYRGSARSISSWVFSDGLRGLTAVSIAAWSYLVVMLMVAASADSLGFIALFWGLEVITVPVLRGVARVAFWRSPRLAERTVIVGAGAIGHLLGEKIGKHPEYNLRLVGYLDDEEPFGAERSSVPVVGGLEDLNQVIERYDVSRVIIAFSRARHQQILDIVRTCADRGVRVNIVPRLFEILSSQTAMDDIEGIPLLDVAHVEMSRFNVVVKRAFDLGVGGVATALVLPVIGMLAVAIKVDSRGPVFFRQERMGRGGRVFRIYKLRSMHVDAQELRHDLADLNEYSGPMFKIKSDPRVTRVGKVLRKWSLDELPQLFNVVQGDMSLVGPRPLWVDEAVRCRGWTKKRLDITPGITGLWQVTGRSDVPFDEMVKLDYMYVTGWTLSWDIKLMLETIPAVIGRRGAY